ncbi:hypothetical protein HNY73_012018 [Argiope bruennichi]|uniref:Uncharacterized protein n=1 Tax=Argiope bruennichi TaxID=94029 RepID=A0A8T0EV69_ARGBR|nr:hypothetical protein HNY73_012018 [Argiope bruennichi]
MDSQLPCSDQPFVEMLFGNFCSVCNERRLRPFIIQGKERKVGEGCESSLRLTRIPSELDEGRVWSLPAPWVGNCPTFPTSVKQTWTDSVL